MVVDAPGLPYLLAVVCAVCILNEEFDLQFVRNQIFNSVEDLGDFTPFVKPNSTQLLKPPAFAELLAVLLSTIQRLDGEDGDMAAAEIWRRYCSESGDRDGNENEIDLFKYPWWGTDRKRLQAIPSEAVLQWLDKHALRELLLPSTAAADDEAPMNPDFEPQLKQLIADGVELGALRSYLSEQPSMDADQISLLTDNILRQSDCLAKYASVLKPYFNKVDNQIQLIYRVQDVGHSAPYKSDGKFFHKVFEKLYDEQVVSEEAFKAWEADSSHHLDKKGTTMARGGQTFLSWLKTAEAE
jgi:hypothetical protein